MRLNLILGTALSLAALVFSSQVVLEENAQNATTEVTEPVIVTASFPPSNPFSHIVNGERNTITLTVENKSGKNITLLSVGGALYNVNTDALVKNLTAVTFSVPLIDSVKLQVPFTFFSEFKPGDIRLNVWIDHTLEGAPVRVGAYDAVVTIVEPEISVFDFKMISTYLVTAALLAGLVYLAYGAFAPKRSTRPKRKLAPSAVSAPVGTVTASGAGYEEEWIPEHHKVSQRAKRTKSATGTLTSGDEFSELSAGELSSPEKEKKGKGKGRK